MKKLLLFVCVLALAVAPAFSDDIPDGDDCAASEGPASATTLLDADDPTTAEPDRGAVCVSDGDASNGSELYVGGEAQAEQDGAKEYAGACGAIIVGGEEIAGSSNWNTDDFHCD